MTNGSSCPSEFALERWRSGELAGASDEAPLVAHLETCETCRSLHAEMAEVAPPPLDAEALWSRASAGEQLTSPGQRRALPMVRWVGAAFAGVALATALFLVLRRAEPDTLTKGRDFQLGVIAKTRDGSVRRIDAWAPLSPGDRLRFEVFTRWPRADIALVMLDSAGNVSRLAPAEDASLAISGGRRVLLNEAVVLDGALGAERIVLVACNRSMAVPEVVASAKRALAAAHGDPRQVKGLGTGCHEETFWITKVSR